MKQPKKSHAAESAESSPVPLDQVADDLVYAEVLERRIEDLHKRFDKGDVLAIFECLDLWDRSSLAWSQLPNWIVAYLGSAGARLYRACPWLQDNGLTPRQFLDMTSRERERVTPSLDEATKLSGNRGKPGAWLWRAEHARDELAQACLDNLMRQREEDQPVFIRPDAAEPRSKMRVFVEAGPQKGKFRGEALDAIAQVFRIRGKGKLNRTKTMRRRFRLEPYGQK